TALECPGGGHGVLEGLDLPRLAAREIGADQLGPDRADRRIALSIDLARLGKVFVDPPGVAVGVGIEADVEDSARRFENPPAVGEDRLAIGEMVKRVDAEDAIEGCVAVRHLLGPTLNERGSTTLRALEHAARRINAGDQARATLERFEPITGPA